MVEDGSSHFGNDRGKKGTKTRVVRGSVPVSLRGGCKRMYVNSK